MNHVERFVFFCSHYGFQVYDESLNPMDAGLPLPYQIMGDKEFGAAVERGYFRWGEAIQYGTAADLNLHRFDVFQSAQAPLQESADRLIAMNINVPSGKLCVFSLDTGHAVNIGPGPRVLFLRAFNVGIEDYDAAEPDVLEREDLERYEIILMPGSIDQQGVISGPQTVAACAELHRDSI